MEGAAGPTSVFASLEPGGSGGSELAEESGETPPIVKGVKLAPFNPTNLDCVLVALEMLRLCDGDILYDLGCGDARFLIQGCAQLPLLRAVGIEYDAQLCDRARDCVFKAGLTDRVSIFHQNVVDSDFTPATAFFVYLVPAGIAAIRPALEAALVRGARIVTYVFSIPGLTPARVEVYKQSTKLYMYDSSSLMSVPTLV